MITVYTFGRAWDMPDPSPFVLKVLVFLELAGIPYKKVSGMGNLRGAPKGKLPYIEVDGEHIGDSTMVIEHLNQKHGRPLDDHLEPGQAAGVHAICKMLDENLYFAMVYLRWADPPGWENYTRPSFFGNMKWPLSSLVPTMLQRGVKKTLHGQGIARHSKDEIIDIGQKDLGAVADFLGDNAFIAGDSPSTGDATVFSFVSAFTDAPHPSRLRDFVLANDRLMAYTERMKAQLPALYSKKAA